MNKIRALAVNSRLRIRGVVASCFVTESICYAEKGPNWLPLGHKRGLLSKQGARAYSAGEQREGLSGSQFGGKTVVLPYISRG